jgi:hypothetical protein
LATSATSFAQFRGRSSADPEGNEFCVERCVAERV